MAEPSRISLYIKNDLKRALKIKAAQDNVSISEVARYYLQNWHLGLMGFVEYENRSALPNTSGIYFVIADDAIKYIGRSIDLRARFRSHHKHEAFQSLIAPIIQWIAINSDELDELESILIELIDPEINGVYPGGSSGTETNVTTKVWQETLDAIREIKKITRETQVLILHRLVVAELKRLKKSK